VRYFLHFILSKTDFWPRRARDKHKETLKQEMVSTEIFGKEWSFGWNRDLEPDGRPSTGIFWCEPRQNPAHHYRQSIELGEVGSVPSAEELEAVVIPRMVSCPKTQPVRVARPLFLH
jgi:hypothetical protein